MNKYLKYAENDINSGLSYIKVGLTNIIEALKRREIEECSINIPGINATLLYELITYIYTTQDDYIICEEDFISVTLDTCRIYAVIHSPTITFKFGELLK